jgi:1-acyl-sn-glycerol-3-phosphate acyltransferase
MAAWGLQRVFGLAGGLEVRGREFMPASGRLLVASNHASFLDPMLVGCALPRPIHFMARKSLFKPIFGWMIRSVLAFPVDRDGDPRNAFRAVGDLLERERAVGIFPEGTRSETGRMGEVKAGIAMLASKYRAPVLPVYAWGTFQSWPKGRKLPRPHRTKVFAGNVISPPESGKDAQRAWLAALTAAMLELERQAWNDEVISNKE